MFCGHCMNEPCSCDQRKRGIQARYIGREGKLGLVVGQEYTIEAINFPGYPLGLDITMSPNGGHQLCPYEMIREFVADWDILPGEGETR